MIFSEKPTENGICYGPPRGFKLKKYQLIKRLMRVGVLIIFILSTTAQIMLAGHAVGQKTSEVRVDFELNNQSVVSAFKKLEKATPFRFIYHTSDVKGIAALSLSKKARSVDEILNLVLNNTDFTYKQIDKSIMIVKKDASTAVVPAMAVMMDVTGTVVGSDNLPLPGVSILEKGTSNGAVTNGNGVFSIKVQGPSSVLVFSYIGYVRQEVTVNDQKTLNVILLENSRKLNEVVVVGYGTMKKANLTGSVAGINSAQIEDRAIARPDQALAGEVAGVQVKAITGTPGQPLSIRVRGGASISASNEPLYVVDGIPVTDLGNINPDEIESINVLKDAASAAIYGSRGSNGVVLVTTKKGKNGPAKIAFSTYFGLQTPEKLIKMLDFDQWVDLNYEVEDINWVAYGKTINRNFQRSDSQAFRIAQLAAINGKSTVKPSDFPTYLYDPRWKFGTDSLDYVDWQKAMFKAAPMESYQVSASGANNDVNYFVSSEYFNQKGLAPSSGFERYSIRANVEAKLNKALSVGVNLSPSYSTTTGALFDGRNSVGQPATIAPVGEKGQLLTEGIDPVAPYAWASTSEVSPIEQYKRTTNETYRTRILSSLYTKLNILKGLNLNLTGGWNFDNNNNKYYQPTNATNRNIGKLPGSSSVGSEYNSTSQYRLFQSVLSYDAHYKEHEMNVIAGYSVEGTHNYQTNQSNSVFPDDNLSTFDMASSTPTVSNAQENIFNLESFFTRLQYSYKNRYLLTASIRKDGFSKFGTNNEFGYFPAFSLGWNISDEPFWEKLQKVVSTFKPRFSYGVTGNNSFSSNYPAIGTVSNANYDLNGNKVTGFAPTTIDNPNLHWEQTASTNYGLDMGFLNNRINLTLEYYNKNTTNLLLNVPVPLATGYATQFVNIGSVNNKGFEVELNTRNLVGAFKWSTTFNIGWNKNVVTKLGNNNTPIFTGFGNTVEITVGQPLVSYYLYDAIGVYKTQAELNSSPHMSTNIVGDPKYRDVNGDGVIDSKDITITGHPNPTAIYGITNTFAYKGFDLSVLIQGQYGGQVFSLFGRNLNRPNTGLAQYNALYVFANRWRSETDPGDGVTPRIDATTAGLYDSRWIYSSDFYKIKSLVLGYNVKPKIKGISNVRIYFSGENLFMKDSYADGYSPEAYQDAYYGDYTSYPTPKVYTLGLNVTF
jgi:TonB-linked SusC/RagA family outer membrane protein